MEATYKKEQGSCQKLLRWRVGKLKHLFITLKKFAKNEDRVNTNLKDSVR